MPSYVLSSIACINGVNAQMDLCKSLDRNLYSYLTLKKTYLKRFNMALTDSVGPVTPQIQSKLKTVIKSCRTLITKLWLATEQKHVHLRETRK